MQFFHDRKADRITMVQEAHPIVGWAIVVPFALVAAFGGVHAWMDEGLAFKLFGLFFFGIAVFMAWLAVLALTEMVATFDGKTRTLTIRRTRPWGESSKAIPFAEIFDVVTSDFWFIEYIEHRVDILLAGERKVRLRSNGEKEIESALVDVRSLIRR